MEINACNTTHRFAFDASDLCNTQITLITFLQTILHRVRTNYTLVPRLLGRRD